MRAPTRAFAIICRCATDRFNQSRSDRGRRRRREATGARKNTGEKEMADYKTILYQKQRNAVLITLNRPNALNAMNQDMMNELDAALAEDEHDAEIRAVVLTGAGGTFSAGEDISGDEPETEWPYGIPKNTSLNAAYNKF